MMVWTRFRSLTGLLHEIIPLQDVDSLLSKIVEASKSVADADYCAIIHSPDGENFRVLCDTTTENGERKYSVSAVKHAFKGRKTQQFSRSPLESTSQTDSFTLLTIEKCLVVPLTLPRNGIHYGVLYLDRRKHDEDFSEIDIETIVAFTNLAAIAIENSELFTRVTVDELTGAMSRNFFLTRLKEEFERAKRLEGDVGILMIDIDNFKSVNDLNGHHVGDQVLQTFCRIISENLRAYDVIGRLGGDEFAILLPSISLNQVYQVAEKLHSVFEHTQWPEDLTITASIGGTAYPSNSAKDATDLLNQTDMALYQAKYGGRKQAVIVGRQTPIYSPQFGDLSDHSEDILTAVRSVSMSIKNNLDTLNKHPKRKEEIKENLSKTVQLLTEESS